MLLPTKNLHSTIAEDATQQNAAPYDEPFLARLRDRDTQAFDQMVVDQAPRIKSLVSRLLGWDGDCDDVVQEVFVAAWEKIDRFRGDSMIASWLYAIAVNQCRRCRRKRGAWRKIFDNLCAQKRQQPALFQSADSGTPVETVHLAINELSHPERELIVLCSLEGKSLDEVSALLKVRKNTLEVRLHRTRKKLKQILKKKLDELDQ